MKSSARHVLVVMHRWVGYLQGVQLGIANYFLQRPNWIWTQVTPLSQLISEISKIDADGVIAYVEQPYLAALKRLHKPVVDISNWISVAPFPRVLADDRAIGRLAARYLRDLGLRHFGTGGPFKAEFARLRCEGFAEALAEDGFSVDRIGARKPVVPKGLSIPPGVNRDVFIWLRQAPKRMGLFALTDDFAAQALNACRSAGVRTPEDVCVLGVDNDELITKVSNPPLSSIALPTQKIGFEAARLLDNLMSGGRPPRSPLLFPPVGVVARQSTDLFAIADNDVQAAVRYIRERVAERLTVKDLLDQIPVNRRYLERKFKLHIGRTPLQEIRRMRLEKAKELLSHTDMAMPAIARQSGFQNAARLANVFHALVGQTPTAFRHRFRLGET